jgi:acylphosphatase
MQTHKRNVKIKSTLNDDTMNPRYIKKIFDTAFLPRISDTDGKRISTEEAMQNIRKLNIVAHCHGAYTFLKLEEMMTAKMKELGYTKQEQQQIQKQLLCVAHAPYCPLGISKSTLISFCSAQDDEVSHHNNFQTEIVNLNKQGEMTLSYFPERQGNVFICSSLGDGVEEHNFIGYDINQKGLSNEGKAILALSGKAIVNGVRGSIKNEPLADIETLICGQDDKCKKIFNKIKENGKAIYNKILYNSIQRHKVAQQTYR